MIGIFIFKIYSKVIERNKFQICFANPYLAVFLLLVALLFFLERRRIKRCRERVMSRPPEHKANIVIARAKNKPDFDTYMNYDWMYKKLVIKKKSFQKVADICQCKTGMIYYWARKLKVPFMPLSERMKIIMNHPNVKAKLIKKMKVVMNKPDVKEKCRKAARISQNLPEVQAKDRATRMKNGTTMYIVMNRPDLRAKKRKIMKIIANRPEVQTKIIETKIKNGTAGGNPNKFAITFLEYFDLQIKTKGRYGLNEIWICDSINKCWYRPDYFNKKIKLIIEYDESHHYYTDGRLVKYDRIKQKVIQERYPDFTFIRIRERDYFSEKKYLKDITEKDYKVFAKIIEDVKAIIE